MPVCTEVSLSCLLVVMKGLMHADSALLDPQLLGHWLLVFCGGGEGAALGHLAICFSVAGLCRVMPMQEAVELAGLTISLHWIALYVHPEAVLSGTS